MLNDGTTRRLCEALSLLALLMGESIGSVTPLTESSRVQLFTLLHGLQIVLNEGLCGMAPYQHAAGAGQDEQWKEMTHGEV